MPAIAQLGMAEQAPEQRTTEVERIRVGDRCAVPEVLEERSGGDPGRELRGAP
jgi:hypothetical protein